MQSNRHQNKIDNLYKRKILKLTSQLASLQKSYESLSIINEKLSASLKTDIPSDKQIDAAKKTPTTSDIEIVNNQFISELLNHSNDAILVSDMRGKFIYANRRASEIFGYSNDELLQMYSTQVTRNYNSSEKMGALFDKTKGRSVVLEGDGVKKGGSFIPIEIHLKHVEIENKEYIVASVSDISDRLNSIQKLKNQKEFYEKILNNIPVDIAVFNPKGEYVFMNPNAIKNKVLRKWLVGKTDYDYCKLRKKNISLAKERTENYDWVIKNKKGIEWIDKTWNRAGQEEYILRRINPVLDKSGTATLLIGSGLNITDRIKIEELYKLVIESSNDGIWDWNLESRQIYLSERGRKMIPLDTDTLNDFSWIKNIDDEDLDNLLQTVSNLININTPLGATFRYRHKDGYLKYFMCKGIAVRDSNGQANRIVGSITDITEFKMAEEKLKLSEEKLNIIFNNSFDAQFLVCPDTHINLECNKRAVALFEYDKKEDLIGIRGLTLLKNPLSEEDKLDIFIGLKEKGYANKELLYVTKTGKEFWGRFSAKILSINNKLHHFVNITDITAKKLVEEELIKAKQEAEESTKAKEIFLANMSHEMRTPMNGILGMADLLQHTSLNNTQQNYLKLIKTSADNLLVIINDILDLSKIQSGKLTLEKIPFDILDVLKTSIQSLSYKAEEKHLHIKTIAKCESGLTLIGDPFRLTQILINLINNAIKFTKYGEIEIGFKIKEEYDNQIICEFYVKDSGIGIPSDKFNSIFESFNQANVNTARNYGGTGLGLNICKNLIEMQGGAIWLESKVNEGSKFTFKLPYGKASEKIITNKNKVIDNNSLKGIRILLAEDNELNQYLALSILNQWGCKVDAVFNGKDAIALLKSNDYHLVLMDIQMPEMGGIEATSIIRQLADTKKSEIPIIALTANALVGDAEKYLNSGMNDYLSKPYTRNNLYEKIYKHVKR